jgi:deoxycytidine triphosphate deaminase
MILGREEIFNHIDENNIVVEPFDKSLVSVNSIDIRLGTKCWKLKKDIEVRDLYKPQDEYWERVHPITAKSVRERFPGWGAEISDDALVLVFEGNEFYLCTTYEKIGTRPNSNLVAEMKSKSTWGRNGLSTAVCAGLGDIGYFSEWALENRVVDGGTVPVAIGTPIGQVVFHTTTPEEAFYEGKNRYQVDDEVRFLPKALPLPCFGD